MSKELQISYNFVAMREKKLTFEHLLFLIIFGFALFLRLFRLGAVPLGNAEAALAWDALQISLGNLSVPGGQPAYSLLTAFLFLLLGTSNALARIVPAIMGSLVILVPFFLRHRLGKRVALIAALGLAMDPVLISDARMAGGGSMALVAFWLAIVAWGERATWNPRIAYLATGVFIGSAALSGMPFYQGVLILLLTWLACKTLRFPFSLLKSQDTDEAAAGIQPVDWKTVLIGFTTILFLLGTWFFTVPGGLAAFAQALPDYLAAWTRAATTPGWLVLAALGVYGLVPLIFGVMAVFRRTGSQQVMNKSALGAWIVAAILVAFSFPEQKVIHLAWALVPLWILAAGELDRQFNLDQVQFWPAVGQAGLVFALLANLGTVLAGLTQYTIGDQSFTLRLVVAAGALVLVGLISSMAGLIWNSQTALRGLGWGAIVALGLYTLATGFPVSPGATPARPELWDPSPKAGQVELFQETLFTLGEYSLGKGEELSILSLVDTPAMRWALRNFKNVTYRSAETGESNSSPQVVITWQDVPSPRLATAYRGQDFGWEDIPYWSQMPPGMWLDWLAKREIPPAYRQVVIWARVDLFPEGTGVLPEGLSSYSWLGIGETGE